MHAGAELPLDAADPRRVQRGDRARGRALRQGPALDARRGRAAALVDRRRRARPQVDYVVERCSSTARPASRSRPGGAVSQPRTTATLLELELARRNIPFVKYGGLKFLEAAHVKDLLALLRWAENPRDPIAGFRVAAAAARHRARERAPRRRRDRARRPTRSPRSRVSSRRAAAARLWPSLCALLVDAARAGAVGRRSSAACARWYEPHARANATTRAERAPATSRSSSGSPRTYPTRERFLTELDARSAGGDQRPGRPAAARRGLPDPVDDPSAKGQEWDAVYVLNVVDGCIPSDIGDRQRRRRSRRSGGCSTSR